MGLRDAAGVTGGGRRVTLGAVGFAVAAGWTSTNTVSSHVAGVGIALMVVAAVLVATCGAKHTGATVALLLVALGLARGTMVQGGTTALQPFVSTGPVVIRGLVAATTLGGEPVVEVRDIAGAAGEAQDAGAVALAMAPGGTTVEPGNAVEVSATGLHPAGARPGARDAAHLAENGVDAVAAGARVTLVSPGPMNPSRALLTIRQRIAAGVDGVLPAPVAPLLLGVVIGIRRPLPTAINAALQNTGLIHIVIMSGLKVSILAGVLRRLCDGMACSARTRLLIVVPSILAYVAVSGGGPAAVRSAVMATVALVAARGGRRTDTVPLLAVTAAGMVAVSPAVIGEIGFQLSFLGTLGIVLLSPPIAGRIHGPRRMVEPFAVTIAAQVATFPLMAAAFGSVSLVAPLANALVMPVLPAVIVAGGVGGLLSAVSPDLGWLPLQGAALGVRWAMAVADALSGVPGGVVHSGSWPGEWTAAGLAVSAAIGVVVLHGRRRDGGVDREPSRAPRVAQTPGRRWVAAGGGAALAVALAVAAGSVIPRGGGSLRVIVLDLGAGGSAAIVEAPAGGIALLDAGASAAAVDDALGRALPMTVRVIDLLVLTGGERMVAGGIPGVTAHHAVGEVLVPDADVGVTTRSALLALHDRGTRVSAAPVGGGFTWDGLAWRCVAVPPGDGSATAPLCAYSVSDTASGASIFFVGGAPVPQQEALAEAAAATGRAGLLVTYPGGAAAPSLVSALAAPQVVVPGARPAAAVSAALGGRVRSTAVDGDVEVTVSPPGERGIHGP